MDNLQLYNSVRAVPDSAKKPIAGGRLKGMTDVNPMWRIKALTEQFGPCGIGWYTDITKQWMEPGSNGECAAFCNIDLYIKVNGEFSKPIPGTGGSMYIANERNGPYTSDECYKMAYTDALSVACKALGFGADVYWEKDRTKYDEPNVEPVAKPQTTCDKCGKAIKAFKCQDGNIIGPEEMKQKTNGMCKECYKNQAGGADAAKV